MAIASFKATKQQLPLINLFISSLFMISVTVTTAVSNFTAYNYLSIQGPNSTTGYNTVLCGHAPTPQLNQFGNLYCFDMPLLTEKKLNSTAIGRVQGTYAFIQLSDVVVNGTVFVSETFVVDGVGTFSGLGLEYIGQYSAKPIVGGTAAYALATGIAYTTPLDGGVDAHNNFFFWFKYEFAFATPESKKH